MATNNSLINREERMRAALPLALLTLICLGCSERESAADAQTGFVDAQGARLYYEEAGTGRPVVLIHGGFLDRRMWDGQFQVLARDYRVIRYDVRAHGLSSADSVPFADHEDLDRLLEALAIDRATIIGLSMGGRIAIDYAVTHPEKAAALVLVGPGVSGYDFGTEEMNQYVEELTAAFLADDFSAVTEVFARWWCDGPQRTPDQVDPAVRRHVLDMLAGSGQRWRYYALEQNLEPPAASRLADIRAPTLVVLGSLDVPIIHDVADLIVHEVPGARLATISGVAHMVNMEKPDEFNRVVLEFLSPH
jgi:pimeloyl-ACP methyl ester carboxylesterase